MTTKEEIKLFKKAVKSGSNYIILKNNDKIISAELGQLGTDNIMLTDIRLLELLVNKAYRQGLFDKEHEK
ncbi:MAG: hypothetical protein WC783_04395 [Candidatus Paceibacterota bacterium]|jgi:hypothetical protein